MTEAGLLIIGGSYAAVQIAASARSQGYRAPIRILSAEAHLPYQRPPLSKAYLLGSLPEDQLPLRSEAFFEDQGIELMRQALVVAVDRSQKQVRLADGRVLPYDKLAFATGARARTLPVPGGDLEGVLLLRDLDDARVLQHKLASLRSVVIIGGGYVGLEVAASLIGHGISVRLLEAQDRLLARAIAPVLSEFLDGQHRIRGVDIRYGATVERITREDGGLQVWTADGGCWQADAVVAGIGALPNDELARASGLHCDNGIVVDICAQTADPDIVAAGDCTSQPHVFAPPGAPHQRVRLESVQNAQDQAKVAGASIAGKPVPYQAVPWFWSDQYDCKLQGVGLALASDACVLRGSLDAAAGFTVFRLREGLVVAADTVNRPAEHMQARKLVAARALVDAAQLADPAVDLKTLLRPRA